MAKKKDEENIETYQRNELSPMSSGPKITFRSWFINRLGHDRRIKQHHFDQIRIFMTGLNLKDEEEQSAYEDGLRVYFGE